MRVGNLILSREMATAPTTQRTAAARENSLSDGDANLLIATLNRSEGETGIHAHTRSLLSGMAHANIPCEAITPFSGSHVWLPIFAVRPLLLNRINKTWSTQWYRCWHRRALERNLRSRIRRRKPAAIIAQCPVSARAALNVRRDLALSLPIMTVCHFNFSEATEYREKGELATESAYQAVIDLEIEVLRRVDKVIYVSQWARQMVEHDRGIKPRASAVIWNGVSGDESAMPIDRTTLGVDERDILLINVGSLEPRKNQLALLDLFAKIAQAHPAAKLLLVGDGPDREAIENKINAMQLAGRVKCLGFRKDVPALLATADLYLHYAKLENCPVVLLEAARASLPAATVPAGGASEILTAIGAGVLLQPDDPARSLRSLSRLMTDASFRRGMGQQARQGFLNRFTQDAMVRAYLSELDSLGANLQHAEAR